MSYYGSVDVHSRNCYVAVSDEEDRLVSHARVPNRVEEVERLFKPYKELMPSVVVESTYNSYWVTDGLLGLGYNVKLANSNTMHQYTSLKHTNDKSDCLWLNRMNRLGILPTGYIYPREERPVRDLLRRRMLLVHVRTILISSLKTQFMNWHSHNILRKDIFKLKSSDVDQWFSEDSLNLYGQANLEIVQKLTGRIKEIESHVRRKAKEDALVMRLREIYGIGPVLGWMIRYETGDIHRFAAVGNFISFCGLVDTVKLSDNKVKGHLNSKNRNKFLRWAFAEAAVEALAHPQIRKYHDRLVRKKGRIKAKAIVASKMARAAYMLMKDPSFKYDQNVLFNFVKSADLAAVSCGRGCAKDA